MWRKSPFQLNPKNDFECPIETTSVWQVSEEIIEKRCILKMFQLQTPSYKKLRLWNLEYSCFTLIDSYINFWRLSQIELLIESQTWKRNKVIFFKKFFSSKISFYFLTLTPNSSVRYWQRWRVVSIKTRFFSFTIQSDLHEFSP